MPLSRSQKNDLVERYHAGLASAPSAFIVDFKGVTVPQVTELRDKVRDTGGSYLVVKNTLARRAIRGTPLQELEAYFVGPTSVAYTDGDPAALAKVLSDFAKQVPAVEFKGGLVEGRAVGAAEIDEIARLPSREELIAKLVFLLQAPIARLVRGIGAIPRQLVVVLDQIRRQREEQS